MGFIALFSMGRQKGSVGMKLNFCDTTLNVFYSTIRRVCMVDTLLTDYKFSSNLNELV